MSQRATTWLQERAPEPPGDLRAAVAAAVNAATATEGAQEAPGIADRLTRAARARLDAARARPGRLRESAFELLVADGLVTYACEASLEGDDPDAALAAILEIAEP